MFKGGFIANLPKIYGLYTGGFAVFIILMAIAESAGVSAKNIGVMFVAFTVLIYALIGYLSRTIQAETSAAKQHPHAKNVPDIDAFTEYTANPTFTPIMILFEPCVTGTSNGLIGNEYEVKVCSQFHCHFKQGSTLANMAKEPRTSLGAVNSATHQEEALGSYMRRAAANELKFQRQRMFGV
jgi:hypothetical protein